MITPLKSKEVLTRYEKTTDTERPIVDGVQEPPQLKIEVAANRYLLTMETLVRTRSPDLAKI
jgi:hypothetical protein